MSIFEQLGLSEDMQKELEGAGFDGAEQTNPTVNSTDDADGEKNSLEPDGVNEDDVEGDPNANEDEDATEDDSTEEDSDAIEVLTTKDGKKITIDYSDRDKIKRAHLLARQGRQWQSELNVERKKLEEVSQKYTEISEIFDTLEEAKDDIPELFRLLTGGEDWDEMIEREIQHRNQLAELTPAQLEVYKHNKLLEKREREIQAREARIAKAKEESEAKSREAEANNQKAHITSAFNEYNFTGQLGDPRREHRLNKKTWNNIRAELAVLENPDETAIRAVIKQEFDDMRKEIGFIQKKVASKARKKEVSKATKKAAASAMPDAANLNVNSDNISSLLANLDKLNL